MTLYKVMADDETTIVLANTVNGWKPCATVANEHEANLYIARQDRLDVARALENALVNKRQTKPSVTLDEIGGLCRELRRAIWREQDAMEVVQEREVAA